MIKDPMIFISHILESIKAVETYVKDCSEQDFLVDAEKQDAVIRRIEIIGEAVRNIPATVRNKNVNIPWLEIADMRNIVIHEYFNIDLHVAWETVKIDLPKLKRELAKLAKEL